MSVIIQQIMDDASVEFADPNNRRISPTSMLLYLNNSLRDLSRRWKILELDATFDMNANQPNYLYPGDMVQMKGMKYSDTPSDQTTYKWCKELFDGESRRMTGLSTPVGSFPFRYHARAQFFEVIPTPAVTVADGGWIQYWKLAAPVTDPTTNLEFPDTLRDFVRWKVIVYMLRNTRDAAWVQEQQALEAEMDKFYDRIEDRSDDRAEAIRPVGWSRGVRSQV